MIKYNVKLEDIPYILGVDLAMYRTGVCLYDTKEKKFIDYREITVDKNQENPSARLYRALKAYISSKLAVLGPIMIVRESLPQQCGIRSSIAALQQLAKAHAALDVVVDDFDNVEDYDETGVHTISVKAFFRSDIVPKPQKEDIRREIVRLYNLPNEELTDNISDAMAIVHVLLNRKWNSDIDARIKELKKEIKQLKLPKAIEARRKEIELMTQLKI